MTQTKAVSVNPSPLPARPKLLSSLLLIGAAWLWVSFFRFQPDSSADFSKITGVLISYREDSGTSVASSANLNIQLDGDPVRYCVPKDGYDYFRRDSFFANVRAGATIQLTVRSSELANPVTSPLNPVPTVFVRGIVVDNEEYYRFDDHVAWQRRNNHARLVLALTLTIVGGVVVSRIIRLPNGGFSTALQSETGTTK